MERPANASDEGLVAANAASFKIAMSFGGTHIVVGTEPGVFFEGTSQASAGVLAADLEQFERDGSRLDNVGVASLAAALKNAGIEFLPEDAEHGAGLQRRTPEFEVQPFHVYPEGAASAPATAASVIAS